MTDTPHLTPLLQQAVNALPEAERADVAKVAVMQQVGMKDMEITRQLGVTWKKLDKLRLRMRAGIVQALREDGYSDVEVARYLGLDYEVVAELHLHETTCLRRMSGEWNASCTCGGNP